MKLVDRPRTYRHWGLDFAILAEYPDNDDGTAQANAFINNDIPTARAKVTGGASNNALGDALAELDGLEAAADFLKTFALKQVEQRAQVLTEVVEGTTAL